jgi:hypothetical protein
VHAEKFKEKHKKVGCENGRLWTSVERKYVDYKSFTGHLVGLSYVKERVKINGKVFK